MLGIDERSFVFSCQSRLVKNEMPYFLWTIKRDVIDYHSLNCDQVLNHFGKTASFTTKVSRRARAGALLRAGGGQRRASWGSRGPGPGGPQVHRRPFSRSAAWSGAPGRGVGVQRPSAPVPLVLPGPQVPLLWAHGPNPRQGRRGLPPRPGLGSAPWRGSGSQGEPGHRPFPGASGTSCHPLSVPWPRACYSRAEAQERGRPRVDRPVCALPGEAA